MSTWEEKIRKTDPYVPGEQPQTGKIIKLNTNESPYPPAPGVLRALKEMDADQFKLYPDYQSTKLIEQLSKRYQVPEDQIFVGVGSDDVLSMSFLTFFNSKEPILFPDLTYSFYKVWAELYRIPYECQPLDENFRIRKEDYMKPNGGIIIANPNAPTSIYENVETFREILDHNPDSVVIVDEAYIDFGGESALPFIKEYDNLLVVQTFSKSRSMAGMRIGYAMGSKKLIQALNDVKYSFNSYTMNMPSIELGAKALEEDEYYKDATRKIIATREDTKKKLEALGFTCLPSSTNFLFVTTKKKSGTEIFEALKKKKIYIRHFDSERISEYLRITIGTPEQMDEVLTAIAELL